MTERPGTLEDRVQKLENAVDALVRERSALAQEVDYLRQRCSMLDSAMSASAALFLEATAFWRPEEASTGAS